MGSNPVSVLAKAKGAAQSRRRRSVTRKPRLMQWRM